MTGIVQNPSNLADKFALVAPGQVPHPSQVTLLLGSAAVQRAISNGTGTLPGLPAAATVLSPNEQSGGLSPAVAVLVVEVLGLVFIGLLSVAGFSVMAQRRLRALGMLSAIGATERNLRLVMIANGLAVGVAGALAGTALGLAAWFAYVPALQQATGHVVDAGKPALVGVRHRGRVRHRDVGARRPAARPRRSPRCRCWPRSPAAPRRRRKAHRSALPGVIAFAVGLACLAFTGGCQPGGARQRARAAPAGRPGRHDRRDHPARPAGHRRAGRRGRPRLPVAIRIALRDLVRYRARSGAALAATTFAVFLAMAICIVASIQFETRSTGPAPTCPAAS